MNQSPLHQHHEKLGARMVPFADWEMPIQYEGIVAEHRAVRESCGIFDISHMGELEVTGEIAGSWLNQMLCNDVTKLSDGEGQYTLMLNENGGVIDDLILYRLSSERFFLVVNAARIAEDVAWLKKHLDEGVSLVDRSSEFGAVAVQGPDSSRIWDSLAPEWPLPQRNGIEEREGGVVVCRTGYTGEDGFELFAPVDVIGAWFERFLEAGAMACGLGARDTLRLEKCYPLNGSDLDDSHTPIEAGLGFFVSLEKETEFIGKSVLVEQKSSGFSHRLAAIAMTGKAPPPRHDYEVRDADGKKVLGILSSGSLSPTLGKGIGLAYLPRELSKPGQAVSIAIRDRIFPAEVVKKPFL